MRPSTMPHPQRQRGALLVYAAISLSIAVILLASIDIGHFFWAKRDLQKVADMAAIAGSQVLPRSDCASATAAAAGNARANGWHGTASDLTAVCGSWSPAGSFIAASTPLNAVQVSVARDVDSFVGRLVFATGGRRISASAIATQDAQLAVLTIRSTLISVDTTKSALLDAVFGGLLGGAVSVSAVGWQGLVDSDINLLDYLDALALRVGVTAGNYEQLLGTDIAMQTLLQAMIDVMQRGTGTAAEVSALAALAQLQAAIPPGWLLQLGDLIGLQQGSTTAGLDAGVQVFSLVQALIQAGNGAHGLVATVPISLPGLANVTIRTTVIEPPQISAIGDPALAKANPTGPNAIAVRTAQIRSIISADLPTLSGISGLLAAVSNLASPVTTLLNDVLHLNLVAGVGNLVGALLGIPRDVTDLLILPPPVRIDVNLDVAAGEARVTDYRCDSPASRSLTVDASTAAVKLRVGKLDAASVFSSSALPMVAPLPLIDIGARRCTKFLLLPVSCDARRPFVGGGVGVRIDTAIAGTAQTFRFDQPPAITDEPAYHGFSSSDIVASLADTLAGVRVEMYRPLTGGGLGGLLAGVGSVLNGVAAILQPVIRNALAPLLDPLLNTLLDSLGVDIARTDVGARLSCGAETELVR